MNCVHGTCSLGGTTFQAGQSAYPGPGGRIQVAQTTPAMAAAGVNQIGSAPGQTGGTDDPPTEEEVANSEVAEDNTENTPSSDLPSYAGDPGQAQPIRSTFRIAIHRSRRQLNRRPKPSPFGC